MSVTSSRRGTVLALARWSAHHPWRAIAGWIAFVALCLVLGSAAGTRQLSNVDSGVGESQRADRAIEAARFPTAVVEQVLIQSLSGPLDARAVGPVVDELGARYAAVQAVAGVGTPVRAANGTALLLPVTLKNGGRTGSAAVGYAAGQVGQMQAVTTAVQAEHPSLRVEEVGDASLETALNGLVGQDLHHAEVLSLPLTLLILLVTFGALFAAGVPVVLALTAVTAAIGLAGLASHLTPITDILSSVILLIGMAVGVDYSLFYVRRAREERAKGATTVDSIELAAATSGRAVLISGVSVMIAMSGMFLSGNAVFVSFAMGTILVVAVAMLGSLTVLPAILAKLGDHVDRPRVPFLHRIRRHRHDPRFWPAVMRVVLARPAISLALGVVTLGALAAPALSMHLRSAGPQDLPRSVAEIRTYDRVVAAFPQQGISHTVVVWAVSPLDRVAVDGAVGRLEAAATATGLFVPTRVRAEYSPDGRTARFDLPVPFGSDDPRAGQSLDQLRERLVPTSFHGVAGATVAVTGSVAGDADFSSLLGARLPLVIGFVLAMSLLVLVLAFRSLVVAATAIVLNLLSVAAAYGLLVLVFQHTWAESLLGFHSNGAVISWLPLFLFVVLFGLSMDYHVFVVSRIREAADRGLSTRDAVAQGVTASAGVVTSAAVVMVGVFGIFATLSLLEFKQLGIGLAGAVLIDAFVVRVVLLPSAMALLGRYNWWLPRPLSRFRALEAEPVGDEREHSAALV